MKYKKGDKIYVKQFLGNTFTAEIILVNRFLFFKKYVCKWTVRDFDYNYSYETIGIIFSWNIIGKIK